MAKMPPMIRMSKGQILAAKFLWPTVSPAIYLKYSGCGRAARLKLKQAFHVRSAFYAKRVTFSNYDWQVSRDIIKKNRRIGISMSGIQDWFWMISVIGLFPDLNRL